MVEQSLKTIMAFFDMTAKDMVKEWKMLTGKDKHQLRNGIEDGSLTY